ncbi:cupredoxin domain-containing protein [Patescibacteria group bacterium]|nr:cupredoxin domain-containing protein [Patescibacteria group bacterium]
MKRVAIVAGLLVLIALLAFIPPQNTIVLKDDGFHPRVLTVSVGDTVTFTNARDKYFWPASDFHPTHALYPEFDAKEPLAPGQSYAITFTEPGTYPFHDHLAAFYFGIVQVQDADGRVVDDCMEKGGQFQCWQNKLFLTLATEGIDRTYEEVATLYEEDPAFSGSCHYAAHNIGLASYQFYQKDTDFILSPRATACAAGFYHGFMEGYIGATGDIEGAAEVCDTIGARIGEEAPDARLQCYHGIGHGAVESAVATSGSFGSQQSFVDAALSSCEEVADGEQELYRCVSGVFNGIANFYIIGAYGLSVKDDPLLLCANQPEVYKEACYGNMNSVVYYEARGEFTPAVEEVFSIPDVTERPKALEYLLLLFALNHIQDESLAPLIQECQALPDSYVASCLGGLVRGLLEHGIPGKEYEKALNLCRESTLTAAERDACYAIVLTGADGWYGAEKVKEICASVPVQEQAYCTP